MIEAEIDVDGLLEAFERVGQELDREMTSSMTAALDVVAARARTDATFRDRSGALRASIQRDPGSPSGSFLSGNLAGTVSAGEAYGAPLEFGSRPHIIRPRHRRTLRIPVEGGFLFRGAVRHPGTREYAFLANALRDSGPQIEEIFSDGIDEAFARAGLV